MSEDVTDPLVINVHRWQAIIKARQEEMRHTINPIGVNTTRGDFERARRLANL